MDRGWLSLRRRRSGLWRLPWGFWRRFRCWRSHTARGRLLRDRLIFGRRGRGLDPSLCGRRRLDWRDFAWTHPAGEQTTLAHAAHGGPGRCGQIEHLAGRFWGRRSRRRLQTNLVREADKIGRPERIGKL